MIFLKIPATPRQLNCARKGSVDKKENIQVQCSTETAAKKEAESSPGSA
jgi:hypothetical protein